jgi:hypothetical protein
MVLVQVDRRIRPWQARRVAAVAGGLADVLHLAVWPNAPAAFRAMAVPSQHSPGQTMAEETCNTCGREVRSPFRSYDPHTGQILHGCVDASHDGHLVGISASNRWHNRKEAKALRAATVRHYRELGVKVKRAKVSP